MNGLISFVIGLVPAGFSLFGVFFLRSNFDYGYSSRFDFFLILWPLAMPLVMALVGAVAGLIVAGIYNFLAARDYALEIDIELSSEGQPAANQQYTPPKA